MNRMLLTLLFFSHISFATQSVSIEKPDALFNIDAVLQDIILSLNSPSLPAGQVYQTLESALKFIQKDSTIKQPRHYIKSTLRIFLNTIKRLECINAYDFDRALINVGPLLKSSMMPQHAKATEFKSVLYYDETMFDRFKNSATNMLYSSLGSNFELLKNDPDLFISNLATSMAHNAQEEMNIEQLRSVFMRLVETSISKLVWSPKDGIDGWQLCKKIAVSLAGLMESNVIDDVDDLNDLLASLVYRYAYCIDLTGHLLPLEFYQSVAQDLAKERLLFVELEEEHELIRPKIEFLKRALADGQKKVVAIEQHKKA